MIRSNAKSTEELVTSVGSHICQLVRFDLGPDNAISYLFDGNEDRPRTCQWRVIAPDEIVLRNTAQQLLECLAARGIKVPPLKISGTTCYFQDEGVW